MPATTPTGYPYSAPTAASPSSVELVADGGPEVGYGHVGRCLALAEAVGGGAVFALEDAAVERFVRDRGGQVGGAPNAPVVVLDRAQATSAAEVRALRRAGRRVVLLDDLGDGREVADMVIDPPTAAAWPPAGGRRLGGFEHVLLRREVRDSRRTDPHGVLVALGGSDPTGLTPALAEALGDQDLRVNLGPGYSAAPPLHGEVLPGPHAFVEALAEASLLVAAYGHSLLEAAYLGVPALIVVTRADHRAHAEAFTRNRTAEVVEPGMVHDRVAALLHDQPALDAMAGRGRELVDGRGADRIAAAIRELVA